MSFDLKNSNSTHSDNRRETEHRNEQRIGNNADLNKYADDQPINESLGKILLQWKAPEFEAYEKSARWYIIFAIFITALIVYALISNSPIMAITFILIGIVGYIHLQKDPRVITFLITTKGVVADKEMYLYDNVHSFWIFYDPPHTRTISLHTKASVMPFIHIPLSEEDPVEMREILMRSIPEIKQDPGLVDTIERVLHI